MKRPILLLFILLCGFTNLPDSGKTPGDVLTADTAAICFAGYSTTVRHVTSGMKEHIYADYGIFNRDKAYWAIDHLIPLCMGGSNSPKNLWPMVKYTPMGKNAKDTLERVLCRAVCAGDVGINQAQYEIRRDWVAAYQKYVLRQ